MRWTPFTWWDDMNTLRHGGQRARQVSIDAYNHAMAQIRTNGGLTLGEKTTLSTKLTNMPGPMLTSLHRALDPNAPRLPRADCIHAIRVCLLGYAAGPKPAPKPRAPRAPGAAPAPHHRGVGPAPASGMWRADDFAAMFAWRDTHRVDADADDRAGLIAYHAACAGAMYDSHRIAKSE